MHLYTTAEKIIKKIDSDGLHVVLAEGIEYIGDKVGEITSEIFVKKVGGFIGKDLFGTAADYILRALDMDKEAKELKEWIKTGLEDMASHLDEKITDTADSFGALLRDPEEWAANIEEDPTQLLNLVGFATGGSMFITEGAKMSWAEETIVGFFTDEEPLKIPKKWDDEAKKTEETEGTEAEASGDL